MAALLTDVVVGLIALWADICGPLWGSDERFGEERSLSSSDSASLYGLVRRDVNEANDSRVASQYQQVHSEYTEENIF